MKVALITGASSGIGEALARECVKRGLDVVLCARRKKRLEALATQARAQGRRALVVACDVTRDGDLAAAVSETEREFGQLDVVIANAGFGVVGPIAQLSLGDFQRQFDTNVYGVLRTFQATYELLKRSKGNFAAVGSVNGYIALPGNAPYAMSKFAVRALCDSLRYEIAADGVSVTHIAPGFVTSEIRRVDNAGRIHAKAKDPIPDWIQMPADKAARKILRAVLRRKPEAVITGHGKAVVWGVRHFPGLFRCLLSGFRIKARGQAASH